MIMPFIAATMRDVFDRCRSIFKESAYGLGCTTWEVMRGIVVPYTRSSVVGGIMLGLGRALGETMAVTFVIGNTNRISPSSSRPATPSPRWWRSSSPRREGSLQAVRRCWRSAFILFVISFIVLAISRCCCAPG
jgi:phosphate transport system permease protein